jgi:Glucan phosphorylase
MSIKTALNSSKFSSDRTIREYVKDIWYSHKKNFSNLFRKIEPVEIPQPALSPLERTKKSLVVPSFDFKQ